MNGPDLSKLIYLLIVGGITAGLAFFSIRNLIAIVRLRSSTPGTGRIVGKRVDDDDGRTYFVTYAYEDGAGVLHEKEIQLGRTNYESLEKGQSAGVLYETGNPRNSYLADPQFRKSRLTSMLGWLLLAAVLAFVIYSFVTQCVLMDVCPAER